MELRAITPLKDLGGRQEESARDNWLKLELSKAAAAWVSSCISAAINISVSHSEVKSTNISCRIRGGIVEF